MDASGDYAEPGIFRKMPRLRSTFFARAWRREIPARKIFWRVFLPSWLLAYGFTTWVGVVTLWIFAPEAPLLTAALAVPYLILWVSAPVLLWRCRSNVKWRSATYLLPSMAVLVMGMTFMSMHRAYEWVSAPGYLPRQAARPQEIQLQAASRKGDLKKVRKLLSTGADVSETNPGPHDKGRTALHYAAGGSQYARNGQHIEVATELLAHGADVNAKAEGGYTPLHVAAGLGQVEFARWLLDNGADVNAHDRRGTPLYAAVLQGHEAVVALLIERKADFSGVLGAYEILGNYYPSHTAILRRLITAGVDVNEADRNGNTALDYLMRGGEEPLLLLLQSGANPGAGTRDKAERVGLFVFHGYQRALDHIFSHGESPNMRGHRGRTLMHDAAIAGEKMLVFLHQRGADHDRPDFDGNRPIHEAASRGRLDSVAWLLKMSVSPNAEGANGVTPLMAACHVPADAREILKLLVSNGASMAKRDRNGLAPLDHAAGVSAESVRLMLEHGAVVGATDKDGYTALHRAAKAEAADALLAAGSLIEAQTSDGRTPLHTTVKASDVVELLIARGANVKAIDQNGATPLHLAAREEYYSVDRLLGAGADASARDTLGRTPMHFAAQHDLRAVERLLKAGADVNSRDMNGDSPLHYAARRNNLLFIREMTRLGADPDVRNKAGRSVAQVAADSAQRAVQATSDDRATRRRAEP